MPIVEARVKGLPAVCSDVADMRQLLAEDPGTAFVEDPRDTAGYVRLIAAAFEAGCPKIDCPVIERLSTVTEAKEYEAFFHEIVANAQ